MAQFSIDVVKIIVPFRLLGLEQRGQEECVNCPARKAERSFTLDNRAVYVELVAEKPRTDTPVQDIHVAVDSPHIYN